MKKICICILITMLFLSCSPRAVLTIQEDTSANIAFSMDSGAVIQSVLQAFGFTDANTSLFDESQIRSSLAHSNLEVEEISFPSKTALLLRANTPTIENLLNNPNDFLSFNETDEEQELKLVLSPQNIQKVIALMPPETAMYLELLFAPIFTGEKLSEEEYLFLISAAYGQTAALELQNAKIALNIETPKPIKKITSSNKEVVPNSLNSSKAASIEYAHTQAIFVFSLSHFLTNLETTEYTIVW